MSHVIRVRIDDHWVLSRKWGSIKPVKFHDVYSQGKSHPNERKLTGCMVANTDSVIENNKKQVYPNAEVKVYKKLLK